MADNTVLLQQTTMINVIFLCKYQQKKETICYENGISSVQGIANKVGRKDCACRMCRNNFTGFICYHFKFI